MLPNEHILHHALFIKRCWSSQNVLFPTGRIGQKKTTKIIMMDIYRTPSQESPGALTIQIKHTNVRTRTHTHIKMKR